MIDLVARLRARWTDSRDELSFEAAAEIKRLNARPQPELDMTLLRIEHLEAEIERLRAVTPDRFYEIEAWGNQQAAELERLEDSLGLANRLLRESYAEVAHLTAALQDITNLCKTSPTDPFLADNMDRTARRALEPKP